MNTYILYPPLVKQTVLSQTHTTRLASIIFLLENKQKPLTPAYDALVF